VVFRVVAAPVLDVDALAVELIYECIRQSRHAGPRIQERLVLEAERFEDRFERTRRRDALFRDRLRNLGGILAPDLFDVRTVEAAVGTLTDALDDEALEPLVVDRRLLARLLPIEESLEDAGTSQPSHPHVDRRGPAEPSQETDRVDGIGDVAVVQNQCAVSGPLLPLLLGGQLAE
jgi:hypothetical protein